MAEIAELAMVTSEMGAAPSDEAIVGTSVGDGFETTVVGSAGAGSVRRCVDRWRSNGGHLELHR